MGQILEFSFLGNSVLNYAIAILTVLGILLALTIFKRIILIRLKKWAEKTATTIDDFAVGLIQNIVIPLAYFGAFYLGVNVLTLHSSLKKGINILGLVLLTIFTARLVTALINYGFKVYLSQRTTNVTLERSMKGMLGLTKVIVWGLAIIFFLDNLGFKISTVIAGLGIGGIAVALAAQAVLKDLFSYFSIVFDRPFEIGDFIIIGDYLGTIEYIGIKTTRIRSLGGEQLIFSNTDLTDSRVRNYKRMEKRRVVFKLGVVYPTKLERLQEIPEIIKDIVNHIGDAACDRVHFSSYGDFSLNFEIVYYVIGADYNKYMDIQQEINLAIKKEFEKRKIEFAYPTQTVYLTK
ncbi:MAG: mechanosensitive ion channel family protein [Omnitrophica bacterium]|nr:mechanosensitive ion channel family protein [Candidatus Omnitrophota bacterium]